LAIDVPKETDVRGATRILRISWDEAWHLMERAVRRGRQAKVARVPARLGVDEKAAAKGQQYLPNIINSSRAPLASPHPAFTNIRAATCDSRRMRRNPSTRSVKPVRAASPAGLGPAAGVASYRVWLMKNADAKNEVARQSTPGRAVAPAGAPG
jgi:hypothetical protein